MDVSKSAQTRARLYNLIKEGYASALLLRPELLEHKESARLMDRLEELLDRNGFTVVAKYRLEQRREFIDAHYMGVSESGMTSKLAESGIKILLLLGYEKLNIADVTERLKAYHYISDTDAQAVAGSMPLLKRLAAELLNSGRKDMNGMVTLLGIFDREERGAAIRALEALGSALLNVEYRNIGSALELWVVCSKEGNASSRLYALRGGTDPLLANPNSMRGALKEVSEGKSLAWNLLNRGVVCQIVHTEPSAEGIIDMLERFAKHGLMSAGDMDALAEKLNNLLGKESMR
ncbi:MAG: hypothetical protein ACP5UH_00205 [Candidatus Micrarchaeia archaeon]